MSELLDSLQQQHQERLEQLERGEVNEAFLDQVRTLLNALREAGAATADTAERAHLRALIRFWAGVAYECTGVYPTAALLPPAASAPRRVEPGTSRQSPKLLWLLIGGACVILIAAGLLAVGWSAFFGLPIGKDAQSISIPVVGGVAVGSGPVSEGKLQTVAQNFCKGVPEIVATFALEQYQPDTPLRWELMRAGETVAAEPTAPWEQGGQYVTVRFQGGDGGMTSGQYDLLLYTGEQIVGMQSFEVLADSPRVLDLQASDVPSPLSLSADRAAFEAGLRVVYLTYSYRGLCDGVEITHALYRGGELIQQSTDVWRDVPEGRRQVTFQKDNGPWFASGDYELAVMLDGQEQGRIRFAVAQQAMAAEADDPPADVPPAFGDIVVALGVLPSGTPVFAAQDTPFDASTSTVYAIFDYEGMRTGMSWSAVWTRAGTEVARQDAVWNAEVAGAEGTHWVVYYDRAGSPLTAGTYSVTLYITDTEQHTAEFTIPPSIP